MTVGEVGSACMDVLRVVVGNVKEGNESGVAGGGLLGRGMLRRDLSRLWTRVGEAARLAARERFEREAEAG